MADGDKNVGLTLVRPDRIGRGPRRVRDQKSSCLESLRAMADVLREKRNAPGLECCEARVFSMNEG